MQPPGELREREYVDDRDLAQLTPISRIQWRRWRSEGEGPPYRVINGHRVVYHWPTVRAWIDEQPATRREADALKAKAQATTTT